MARRRFWKTRKREKPGSAPGTLVGDPAALASQVHLFVFDADTPDKPLGHVREVPTPSLERIRAIFTEGRRLWLNVDGLKDVALIEALGGVFGLHRLALEDVVSGHQRPKIEDYEDHLFIVLRMAVAEHPGESEQVGIFLGPRFVLTFQERPGDSFEPVRERLRRGQGRLRAADMDYLAYALIDAAVDGFFPVLERMGDRLEQLEDAVVDDATPELVGRIHDLKRELLALRRAIWPQREMLSSLIRDEAPHFSSQTRVYLRDCYDHTIQLMDLLETYREIASGLMDIYLSSMSARLNEVMKVLTVISTIFIPLGFIASLYGMNFDRDVSPYNMPELGWYFGYPLALLVMGSCAGLLLYWFYRRGWLRSGGK
ncbi:MAG: magnesium/cobalt transporter CorA [Geminicoccaceae bacterium]|nr:magnesium/cobalt transporter CorA [Geminicoccaceae bacterium]